MNKAERLKLHSILSRLDRGQDKINERLDAVDAGQVMLGALIAELEIDVKNILLILVEMQRQQRASSGPDLKIVVDNERPRSPAE